MGICKCPFCHEPLEFERVEWVACAGCLARHHASCWTEAPRCATCGDSRALSLPPPRAKPRRALRVLGALARVSAVALLLVGAPIGSAAWLARHFAKEIAAQEDALAAQSLALKAQRDSLDELFKAQTKHLEKVAARTEAVDRTDEVLERVGTTESNVKRRVEVVSSKVEALGAEVSLIRRSALLAPTTTALGVSGGLEVLKQLERDGELRSSEVSRVKAAILGGQLTGEVLADVARLAKLRSDGTISRSDFDRAKSQLLPR